MERMISVCYIAAIKVISDSEQLCDTHLKRTIEVFYVVFLKAFYLKYVHITYRRLIVIFILLNNNKLLGLIAILYKRSNGVIKVLSHYNSYLLSSDIEDTSFYNIKSSIFFLFSCFRYYIYIL